MILTIENAIDEGYDVKEPIKLPVVNAKAFKKVYDFCKYIESKEPLIIKAPFTTKNLKDYIDDKWYVDFINIRKPDLFELINAADYLEVPSLSELSCAKAASLTLNMTIE